LARQHRTASAEPREIARTSDAGKPVHVHVYFSDEPISRNADPAELVRLNNFREEMQANGLLGVYAGPDDLGYQVREAIEHDLTEMDLGVARLPVATPPERAMPRVSYDEHSKRLVVQNLSRTVGADQFVLEVEGAGDDDGQTGFLLQYDGEPVNLLPVASAHWPLVLFWGSPRQTTVTMQWVENGEAQQDRQTVYFY
jgi:hypothetical protein